MSVTLRGLTAADIPAWNVLLADIERVEQIGEHYNEADLAEEMANSEIDPVQDMVGAFHDETMVGYFTVYPRTATDECHKVSLEGAVHPEWRGSGIGTELATAMMQRAASVHAERHPQVPALYTLNGPSANADQADLLARVGLRPERWSFVMRAVLGNAATPDALPEGLELRRYDATCARAMRDAHNAAFMDHPNFTPWSELMWRERVVESRNFRPGLSFVVVDANVPDQVAAYVQTNEYDAYLEVTGRREAYVAKVGTRREHRGRGLASALLQHCLQACQAAGYDEAALDVDSENPTGALGVYERAGFVVESKLTDFALLSDS